MRALIVLLLLSAQLAGFAIAGSAPLVRVPLCSGLKIVTAISQPEGDYESIKTITSIGNGTVQLSYSTEHPVAAPGRPPQLRKLHLSRTVREADLVKATLYLQQFQTNVPAQVPGTTAIGVSTAVLSDLKTKREAPLGIFQLPPPIPGGPRLSADPKQHPNVFEATETYLLKRVESGPVMLPLIVNDARTELPAVHATGRSEYYGYKGEFFFLDDESNPLALKWRLGIGAVAGGERAGGDRDTLEVINISYDCRTSSGTSSETLARLERALAESGHADLYEIYFSFNSEEIRDESDQTLHDLSEILHRHPDWRLSVGGHTDSIGGDAFNLDLSRRRAAAVKHALVARFGIDADRLGTDGYGRSRPVDTNDTPEGRARNRRVELVRESR
jgi:outer membrane protein OmpA-like peptidoglycan-associated protein